MYMPTSSLAAQADVLKYVLHLVLIGLHGSYALMLQSTGFGG
jgi:hypothetical protein